jgi:hypothetical protein
VVVIRNCCENVFCIQQQFCEKKNNYSTCGVYKRKTYNSHNIQSVRYLYVGLRGHNYKEEIVNLENEQNSMR